MQRPARYPVPDIVRDLDLGADDYLTKPFPDFFQAILRTSDSQLGWDCVLHPWLIRLCTPFPDLCVTLPSPKFARDMLAHCGATLSPFLFSLLYSVTSFGYYALHSEELKVVEDVNTLGRKKTVASR
jgi:hypothetical protein